MPRSNPCAALLAVLVVGWWASGASAARPEWARLRGRPIVEVRILAREVFDPTQPEERHFLFGWANALHVRTRQEVIRRELLQSEGQPFDPRRIEESERNLRDLGIFQDVLIQAEEIPGGVLLEVHTSDRWSTRLRTDVSHRGGISAVELGIEDTNLLGSAIRVGGAVVSSTDLDAASVSYGDPRCLNTRWDVTYQMRSDPLLRTHSASVLRPFYSETVRWSAGLDLETRKGDERLFDAGEETARLAVRQQQYEGFAAVHGHQQLLSRWALLGARRHLTGDDRDDVAAVGLTWARLQRDFRRLQNIDFFGVGEDVASGWTVQVGGGSDLHVLGALQDRPFWLVDAAWARFLGGRSLLGASMRQHAFVRDGGMKNGRLAGEVYGFWRGSDWSTLAWRLGGAAFVAEPAYLRFTLGGDDRLRGYEAHHMSGTRTAYLNLEERLFSGLGLSFLRFGAVAFVDVAAAWDRGEILDRGDARLTLGLGLRVANNKSGSGMTCIDVGFGAGSVQVSVSSGSFFRVARAITYATPRLFE